MLAWELASLPTLLLHGGVVQREIAKERENLVEIETHAIHFNGLRVKLRGLHPTIEDFP
jgi:hypothetical protein